MVKHEPAKFLVKDLKCIVCNETGSHLKCQSQEVSQFLASHTNQGLEEDEFLFPQSADLKEVHDSDSEDSRGAREFGSFEVIEKESEAEVFPSMLSDDSDEEEKGDNLETITPSDHSPRRQYCTKCAEVRFVILEGKRKYHKCTFQS